MLDWWVFGPRRRTQTVVIKLNRVYYNRQIKRRNQGWWVRAERHNERYSVRVKKQINFRLTEWYWNKHFKQVEAEEPKADEMKLINTPGDTQLISDTRDTNTGTQRWKRTKPGALVKIMMEQNTAANVTINSASNVDQLPHSGKQTIRLWNQFLTVFLLCVFELRGRHAAFYSSQTADERLSPRDWDDARTNTWSTIRFTTHFRLMPPGFQRVPWHNVE